MRAKNVAVLAVLGLVGCGPGEDVPSLEPLPTPASRLAGPGLLPPAAPAPAPSGASGAAGLQGTPTLPLDPIPIAPTGPGGAPPAPLPPAPR